MKMDLYATWRALLAGEKAALHESEPACGFYRLSRSKDDKTMVGVAIWAKDPDTTELPGHDGVYAKRDDRMVDIERVWPFCARYPVTEEAYRAWADTGAWPDDHVLAPPAIGHNSGDDIEVLRDQIESASAGASDYAAIDSDEKQAKAQSLRARLLELGREAKKKREALVRPHLDAQKEINSLWMPLEKESQAAADKVRDAMSAWETEKDRRWREAQRQAEAERRAADEAARKAADAGKPVPIMETAPVVDAGPTPLVQVKGAYGKAATVKTVNVATITDQDAFTAWPQVHDHPKLKTVLGDLAQRAVDAGLEPPGVEIEQRKKVA
jgi:hypothetical protein